MSGCPSPRPRRSLVVVTGALLACCAAPNPPPRAPETPVTAPPEPLERESPPALRLPHDTRPLHYDLSLAIDPARESFAGEVVIDVELDRARETIWMHGQGLEVQEASVRLASGESHAAVFEVVNDDGLAGLRLPLTVEPGRLQVVLRYTAPFGGKLRGLYKVVQDGQSYAFTQFEPVNAREAFPCFDEPRFKTPFEVRLTVPVGQVAIANTLELGTQPAAQGQATVHSFAVTEPLPTYLVAFAVGPLDVVDAPALAPNDIRDRAVPFRGVAAQGRGEQMEYALAHTPAIVDALEAYFDYPYPYDKLDVLAVPDFAAGAMENAGAITFREYFLLFTREVPERQRRLFAEVMAHELAHQWFGNLVTMPYWDDVWLNEAFATWMAARIIDGLYPEYELNLEELRYTHWAMRTDELQSARAIRQPIESSHDIENAFDGITYTKGGSVLNMFEQYIGAETFRTALRAYVKEHAFGSATAEDLVAAMSKAAGKPLTKPFFSFLTQPGVPLVRAQAHCEEGKLRVSLAQSRYVPLGGKPSSDGQWQIPVCIRYAEGDGAQTECTLLEKPSAELEIETAGCPAWWMPNAGARGYYRWSISGEDFTNLTRRGWRSLGERERQSTVESIAASLRAGEVSPAHVYPVLFRLLASGDRHVVSTALDPLGFAADHLLDESGRARYRRRLAAVVGPRLRRVGYEPRKHEPGEVALLRRSLVSVLCLEAQDRACRKRLEHAGRARLGLEKAKGPELPADLIGIALEVAVQDGGAEAFDAAVAALFESSSSVDRSRLLSAIGSVTDSELAARARPLTLDPRLKGNEVLTILFTQSRTPELRVGAWQWMLDHLDAIAERVPGRAAGRLVALSAGFCSVDAAQQVRERFGPLAERFAGGPRELSNVLEGIELCAAQADALGESARGFFGP